MHLKRLLSVSLFVVLSVLSGSAWAQTKAISGKVTDKQDGSPLVGVSVQVKGSNVGTATGPDGTFKISVPETAATLVFTYIGYNTQEVNINGKTSFNVSMQSSSTSLNEVVVIGYGTQKVKDATGSVASLGPKNFNKGVIASPEQLLQGRVSGVQVTPASGEPGAGVNINIRGAASIRSGNTPLFVVDGVPLDNGGTSGGLDAGAGTSSARNPLAFLNPADIENISVLKDASAAAIYGSRAANGVVLITTKKGGAGQGVQFSVNTSLSSVAKRYDLLNASDFVRLAVKAGATESVVNQGSSTDWQDQIFRNSFSQNYNLGFGNAGESSAYRVGLSYDNQQGIVKNSELERFTARLNASQNLFNKKVKLELNLTGSNVRNKYAPISNNSGFEGSLIGATILANPTFPVRNPDGTYFSNSSSFRNPVNMLDYIDDSDNINRFLGNINGTWNIINGLSYKATYGADRSRSVRETWMDNQLLGYTNAQRIRNSPEIPGVTTRGRGIVQNQELTSQLVEHTLTYDGKFGVNLLNLLGGFSYQQFKNYTSNHIAWDQIDKTKRANDLEDYKSNLPTYGDKTKSELQSFFARANYSYNDKYFLTATLRADGSSKFGKNNKYGYFPAFAAKWKIMNESFAPKSIFDDLSLRLNYGQTGNQELPAYASLSVNRVDLDDARSIRTITDANPNLKWETTTTYGAGLDFAILKNRLTGTIDYFNRSTEDMLFLQDYPAPSASNVRWVNLPGKIINRGLELGLTFAAVQKQKFNWEIVYNTTFLKNTVKDFGSRIVNTGNIDGQGLSGAYAQTIKNGYPLGSFYLPKFTGFDANGIAAYVNDGLSFVVGSALPKFTTSLTNNFTFGRFNASIFLNAATGFYIYNNTANAYFLKGSLKNARNVTYDAANSPEDPLNAGSISTRFLEKGDFLRLSNLSLGYTFGLANAKVIKSLRVNLSAQNLLLMTNYSGLDPEVNTNKERFLRGTDYAIPSLGIDYAAYPSARTFTLGINAGF